MHTITFCLFIIVLSIAIYTSSDLLRPLSLWFASALPPDEKAFVINHGWENAMPIFLFRFVVENVEKAIDFAYYWAPTVFVLSALVLYFAMSDPAIRYYQRRRHTRSGSPTFHSSNSVGDIITFIFLPPLVGTVILMIYIYLFRHFHPEFDFVIFIRFKEQAARRVWQGRNRYHHWTAPRDFPRFECMIKHSLGCEIRFMAIIPTRFDFWCRVLPLHIILLILEELDPVPSLLFRTASLLTMSTILATILETGVYFISQAPEEQPAIIRWLRNDNKTVLSRE